MRREGNAKASLPPNNDTQRWGKPSAVGLPSAS